MDVINYRLSEQRRQKVKELEAQLTQYKRRLVDYSKVVKMKEQMAKDLTRVNSEILVRKAVLRFPNNFRLDLYDDVNLRARIFAV